MLVKLQVAQMQPACWVSRRSGPSPRRGHRERPAHFGAGACCPVSRTSLPRVLVTDFSAAMKAPQGFKLLHNPTSPNVLLAALRAQFERHHATHRPCGKATHSCGRRKRAATTFALPAARPRPVRGR